MKSAVSCVAMRRNRKSVISISALRSGDDDADGDSDEVRGVASEDESADTVGTLSGGPRGGGGHTKSNKIWVEER